MEKSQQSKNTIYFDTPNVFTELQQDPITILGNITHTKPSISAEDLLVQNMEPKLTEIAQIEQVFTDFLKGKVFQHSEADPDNYSTIKK